MGLVVLARAADAPLDGRHDLPRTDRLHHQLVAPCRPGRQPEQIAAHDDGLSAELFGDMLRIFMSSMMCRRSADIGLVIGELPSSRCNAQC